MTLLLTYEALSDEIFDNFPLFEETLRNIEICYNVICHIPQTLFQQWGQLYSISKNIPEFHVKQLW